MRTQTFYHGMNYGTDPNDQARREVDMIVALDNIYKVLLELLRLQTSRPPHDME